MEPKKNNCNCFLICSVKDSTDCKFYSPSNKYDEEIEIYKCIWREDSAWCYCTSANYESLTKYLNDIYKQLERKIYDKDVAIAIAANKSTKKNNNTEYPVSKEEQNEDARNKLEP